MPDKILNFKHAVNAHPVKAEIEDEALCVWRCFYTVCRPAGDMMIMLLQAYTMTHGKSHNRSQNIVKCMCTYYTQAYEQFIYLINPKAAISR